MEQQLHQVWPSTLADVVYETTGSPSALAGSLGLARNDGRLVLVGDPVEPSKQAITPDVLIRGVSQSLEPISFRYR